MEWFPCSRIEIQIQAKESEDEDTFLGEGAVF